MSQLELLRNRPAFVGEPPRTDAGLRQYYDLFVHNRRPLLNSSLRCAVLFLSDLAALLISLTVGYLTWARPLLQQTPSLYLSLLPLFSLFFLSYAASGLYPGMALGTAETVRRLFYSTSVSFLMLAATSFALKADAGSSRATFGITWAIALVLVPLLRFLTAATASRYRWWREPAIIFGTWPQLKSILRSTHAAGFLGYTVVGAICSDPRIQRRSCEGIHVLGSLDVIPMLAMLRVKTVLALDTPSHMASLVAIQEHVPHLVCISNRQSLPVEQVRVRWLGQDVGIEFTNQLLRTGNKFAKRALDLVVAAFGLLLGCPLMLVCGTLTKLVSPGPMFYGQQREGLRGRRFTVWKLRTMYRDAEQRLSKMLTANPRLREEWERNLKLRRDPRVIPILGHLLRRLSVDEIPQLWNVIKGDMSLVGPRPLPEYHLRLLAPESRRVRSTVRPGLTGMWQVMMRNDGTLADHERFDTYYVRNWSIWLDLYLLGRTGLAVLLGGGAY